MDVLMLIVRDSGNLYQLISLHGIIILNIVYFIFVKCTFLTKHCSNNFIILIRVILPTIL